MQKGQSAKVKESEADNHIIYSFLRHGIRIGNNTFAIKVFEVMNFSNRLFLVLAILGAVSAQSQKLKRAEKQVISQLETHIGFLASDKLEGRRAGTTGEALASAYIIKQFEAAGLAPAGENKGWLQTFSIYDGKDYKQNSYFYINGEEISTSHFFPFALSPEKIVEGLPSIALKEAGVPWFVDLIAENEANRSNPHFDAEEHVQSMVKTAAAKGATALILYNDPGQRYQPKQKGETLPIPVFVLDSVVSKKFLSDETASLEVKARAGFRENQRTGNNVIGYLDNGAAYTILIGAHFDHLGYGEDGNSMLRTGERSIHNGADDNASGTAALLELARLLKKEKNKSANYLFLAFSGEELGLFGSKYYTEHPTLPLNAVSYMLNLDMVGRLNDSSHTLTIGGYGTSPSWSGTFSALPKQRYLQLKLDSSGTGPSDHSSFYRKDIPVLFFFTGLHTDYHKPSDDANKINYLGELRILQFILEILHATPTESKLAFTKTREVQMGSSARFSVSLGIMPDYSFSGNGVKIDGVSDNKPAKKAGLQAGDVILKLGELPTASMEQYMQALGKFKKGDKTTVTYMRGSAALFADIQF